MSTWSAQTLNAIRSVDDLHIASYRADGVQDAVDGADRTEYASSPYPEAAAGRRARAATVLTVPRDDG